MGVFLTRDFRLAYNQISSVDVKGSAVIVSTASSRYKVYVANGAEIQDAILDQLAS